MKAEDLGFHLRRIFPAPRDLPADMLALLEKLDRVPERRR